MMEPSAGFSGEGPEDQLLSSMPWDQHPSIYEHILANIDPQASGLTDKGYQLPDEERINAGSKIRWAAGAMDGVTTHHFGDSKEDDRANETVNLLLAYCNQPTAQNKAAIYNGIINENIVSIIDEVLVAIASEDQIDQRRLYELACSFTLESTDREPTKFGIALLGLFGESKNEEIFLKLGRHDEFTLYCAVAIAHSSESPEQALWKLARHTKGWGRIHVVARLADTHDAEIKSWLLREGFRNSIMYEYSALTCAETGDLLTALCKGDVDRELLTSAGELLSALINGGPAPGIDCYEDAGTGAQIYLKLMEDAAETLADFLHVHGLQDFLKDENTDWEERVSRGWSSSNREEMLKSCHETLNKPKWKRQIEKELNEDDDETFHLASQAAILVGLETWEHHWRRWQNAPMESGRFFHVVNGVSHDRLPTILEAAEATIDLASVATGASDELGFGPGFEHHGCLDFLLQELRRFPGEGAPFIEAGLKSPVVRNRNLAVNALAEWSENQLRGTMLVALQNAAKIEPKAEVQDRMRRVLNAEPLDD